MFHMFRSIYPLHFDVKDIHIRIYIIFHENFTQKTIYSASIYFLQGNSTAAAGIQKLVLIAMSSQKNRNTHDRKFNAGTYEIL
jgi:hypothetical protein